MEHELPGNRFDSVVAENFAATYQMTRHLIELGHKRIAFAYHPLHQRDPVARERVAGFNQAMSDAGLKQKASLLLDACDFGERLLLRYRPEEIVNCFTQQDRPTALFAGMDLLAICAMETLREMGLQIPRDVAVVSFDNIEFSQWTSPPLTTVHTPTEEMGRRAVEILFDRIESNASHRSKISYERLPCRLVIRQSCGGSLRLPQKL
jgi:DNA-binding LacI/PurR family transcriptional regulator